MAGGSAGRLVYQDFRGLGGLSGLAGPAAGLGGCGRDRADLRAWLAAAWADGLLTTRNVLRHDCHSAKVPLALG